MRDAQIRKALKGSLLMRHKQDPHTLVVDELGLRHGRARVDVAVVNGSIHGYEIKSDHDTLRRLPEQVLIYDSVLDYATLVIGIRYAERALPLLPEWWGMERVEMDEDEEVQFSTLRAAQQNPSLDPVGIAKLLWRSEALALLEEIGAANGVRSKPRAEVYARLAEAARLDWLRASVCRQLKSRTGWRAGRPQTPGDD
ncbi:MAG: sce7726 family protein [Gemmatimonadetes bacterium]|nr:sce7726 family protein [Gemmatimonadota bacterium]MBA4159460.1 sce7726 family protein [Gemmatimonadota bacterium]